MPATGTTTDARPERLVAGLACRAALRGALIWGAIFALTVLSSLFAYKSTYGTPADRAELLRGIGSNSGIQALFGPARDIGTIGGFLAWRTLGLFPMVAAIWGLLAGTRLLRGEEESGRWETLLAAPLTRGRATLATVTGLLAAAGVLFALTAVGTLVAAASGDISVAGALWLALALTIAAPAFAALGALTSQLAATRREAAALAGAIFAAAFVVRVAADGSASLGWLRWLTPLGWIEELRPLTGWQPLALLPLLAWTALLTVASVRIAARRDLGAAVLRHSDERTPRHLGLGGPGAFAGREALGGLVGWALGLGLTAFVFGFISKAVADIARTSAGVREHVRSTTSARIDIASAEGYLALVFIFLAVALCLYAVTHATAARAEEATGRADTMLAGPLGRRRWLGGRVLVGALMATVLAAVMALCAWAGAAVKGAGVTLPDMLQAAGNTLPLVVLFLGLATLGFALVPRHTGAIAFGLVGFAYLWEQTGAILKAPEWVLAISPFHWLALVPSEPFDVTASLVMLTAGVLAALLGVEAFRRRDVVAD